MRTAHRWRVYVRGIAHHRYVAVARRLRPAIIVPAMATQRAYPYESDISQLGKAARPKGWRLVLRHLKRGYYEIRLAPRQILALVLGRGRLVGVIWQEVPDTPSHSGDASRSTGQ